MQRDSTDMYTCDEVLVNKMREEVMCPTPTSSGAEGICLLCLSALFSSQPHATQT